MSPSRYFAEENKEQECLLNSPPQSTHTQIHIYCYFNNELTCIWGKSSRALSNLARLHSPSFLSFFFPICLNFNLAGFFRKEDTPSNSTIISCTVNLWGVFVFIGFFVLNYHINFRIIHCPLHKKECG